MKGLSNGGIWTKVPEGIVPQIPTIGWCQVHDRENNHKLNSPQESSKKPTATVSHSHSKGFYLNVSASFTTQAIQPRRISSASGLPMCALPPLRIMSLTLPRLATSKLSSIGRIESSHLLTVGSRREGCSNSPQSAKLNFLLGSSLMYSSTLP